MNEHRLKGLLGLSVRAGLASFGEDTCRRALQKGAAALLLMDGGIAGGSSEKMKRACGADTPCFILPAGLLEEATGRSGRVMILRAGSLTEKIREALAEARDGNEPPADDGGSRPETQSI